MPPRQWGGIRGGGRIPPVRRRPFRNRGCRRRLRLLQGCRCHGFQPAARKPRAEYGRRRRVPQGGRPCRARTSEPEPWRGSGRSRRRESRLRPLAQWRRLRGGWCLLARKRACGFQRVAWSSVFRRKDTVSADYFVSLTLPKILPLGKMRMNLLLPSLIRIFNSVLDTASRKNASKLAFFARLIRIFDFAEDSFFSAKSKHSCHDSATRTPTNHRPDPPRSRSGHRLHRAHRRGSLHRPGRRAARCAARKNRGAAERQHPQERHGRGDSRYGDDRPADCRGAGRFGRTFAVRVGGAARRDARSRGAGACLYRRKAHFNRSQGGHRRETLYRNRGRSCRAPGRGCHCRRAYPVRLSGARRGGGARRA